jgi:hypothetical protein
MTGDHLQHGQLVSLKADGPVMAYEGKGCLGDALSCGFDGGKRICEGLTFAALKRAECPDSSAAPGAFARALPALRVVPKAQTRKAPARGLALESLYFQGFLAPAVGIEPTTN